MELKVWVDGIQRVVCGAGYETTCRDVVLALAHSMSRTGRFTLVEKWRESERPLTPSECPLLSLHKWGEYASEVKFYLIQAESEKPLGGRGDGKLDELISKMPKFNGCTNPAGYDSLKRSLTFSGGNTAGVVPHSSRNAGDTSSSYHAKLGRGDMTTSSSPSLSSSGGRPDLGFRNAKLAKNFSNSHTFQAPLKQIDRIYSPKSSTKSDSLVAGAKVLDVREQRPAGIVGTNRGDVRELHPANIPGSASMYGQGQHMSHHNSSYPNPAQQAGHSGHTVPSLPSQRSSHFQPSQRTATLSTASQNLHPANAPSPVPIPASRQGHQQLSSQQLPASAGHLPPSQAQSQQGNPFHPLQSASSQPSSSHSSRPLIKQRPLPAPRHSQTTPTLVDNSNAPPQVKTVQAPQPRQRSRERIGMKEAQTSGLENSKSDQIKFLNFHNNKQPILDDSFYSNDDSDNKFPKPSNIRYAQNRRYRDSNTEVAEITGHINANNNSNAQGHLKTVENVRYPPNPPLSTFKSSTLERSVPRQNKVVPAPARSLSTEENKPDIVLPATGAVQPQYGGSRLNFVDSAAMKKLRPHAEVAGKAGPVSTFTSAVAHLRQRSADGILQLKPETHVRQLSSDSSHNTAAASQPGFESNKVMVPTTDHPKTVHSGNHSSIHENQTKQLLSPNHLSSPSSSSPPHSASPVSAPRFSSAFKEVSPRSSSQGFQLPVRAPIPYSMDQPSFSTFGIGAPPYRPPIDGQHSRQPSVEVEEYDLDRNFPDVSHRDPVTGSSVSKNWNIPVEYSLDSGSITPVKSETEYLQLVRLIKMQQERLQMQEARISDTEMEISTLETQESQNQANQDVFTEELSKLERMEKDGQQELMELEKVHWENVMNGEKKIETSLKSQMTKLQEQIEELESKLQELRSEEEGIHKEIESEKEAVELRNKISQESERTAFTELSQLKENLSHINKSIQMNENRLKDCEESVLKIEEDILDKEKKIESLTKEMMHNESGDIQSPVMMSKSSSLPKAYQNTVSQSVKAVHLSASDNGEAVLKILEGRLSPHPGSDGISGEGFKSPQAKLNSPVTTKNPDGVWV